MSIIRLPASTTGSTAREQPEHSPPPPAILLPQPPTLSEIFLGNGRDAGGVGFAVAQSLGIQSAGNKPLLWVQDRLSILETGRPYPPGLGVDLIHVEARDARAALWAMEEGLRCPGLRAVVGEIWGNPRALDFTATRRLAVAAERCGVSAILLLFDATPNLSGARMRWLASSRPSLAHPHDPSAPGSSVWSLDLFKARGVQPGRWEAAHEADGLRLLAQPVDGQLASAPIRRRAG